MNFVKAITNGTRSRVLGDTEKTSGLEERIEQIPVDTEVTSNYLIAFPMINKKSNAPLYMKEGDDLLSNASSMGYSTSYKLPLLSHIIAKNDKHATEDSLYKRTYHILDVRLKNVEDEILQDRAAIAILTEIDLNNGIAYEISGCYARAYENVTKVLRKRSKAFWDKLHNRFEEFGYDVHKLHEEFVKMPHETDEHVIDRSRKGFELYQNTPMDTAFRGLLKRGYIAQGKTDDGKIKLVAISKIDDYLDDPREAIKHIRTKMDLLGEAILYYGMPNGSK